MEQTSTLDPNYCYTGSLLRRPTRVAASKTSLTNGSKRTPSEFVARSIVILRRGSRCYWGSLPSRAV